MDSRATKKTEGSGRDPTIKGVSLIKHTKEKQGSSGALTAESHDDSEKKQGNPGDLTAGSHDDSEKKQGNPGDLTAESHDDSESKGSLIKHSKIKQGNSGALTAESHDDSEKKQGNPGDLTAENHDDSENKGSLIKHSKIKQGGPGVLTAENPDTSEKSDASGSEVGGASSPLPANPGLAALGSVLQSKQDPYFVLEQVAPEHIEATRLEMETAIDIMLPLVGPRMGTLVAHAVHSFFVLQGVKDKRTSVGNSDINSLEFWRSLFEVAEYVQLGQEQDGKETIASKEAMGALGILHGVISTLQWFIVGRLEKFGSTWGPGLKPSAALFAGARSKELVKGKPSSTALQIAKDKLAAARRAFTDVDEDDLADLPTAAMLFWLAKNLQAWAVRDYYVKEDSAQK
jgi:hypothetical protein